MHREGLVYWALLSPLVAGDGGGASGAAVAVLAAKEKGDSMSGRPFLCSTTTSMRPKSTASSEDMNLSLSSARSLRRGWGGVG